MALDNPYIDFKNSSGLMKNSLESKKIGYKGKCAIHPAQRDDINKSFSPTKLEIKHAQQIVSIFEKAVAKGRGATSINGKVVDVPVFKRAENLLNLSSELGLI